MMKTAIILGGYGSIGRALIAQLEVEEIPYYVIGSSKRKNHPVNLCSEYFLSYINFSDAIQDEDIFGQQDDVVIFNLAWRGNTTLMDGGIEDQISNIDTAVSAVELASRFTSCKLLSLGSMEEIAFSRAIKGEVWLNSKQRDKSWYGLSKLGAYQQVAFHAYLKKIDFCHCLLSVAVDCGLRTTKFIEQSLKNILEGNPHAAPLNKQLFNFCSVDEIAKQLLHVGLYGANMGKYVLGSGHAQTLSAFFEKFQIYVTPQNSSENAVRIQTDTLGLLRSEDFSNHSLTSELSYHCEETDEKLFQRIVKNLACVQ